MADILERLRAVVGDDGVLVDAAIGTDYAHDEALTAEPVEPVAVVLPKVTEQVAAIMALAHEERLAVVPRGSGTGLSGGAVPVPGGIVVALERMKAIKEVDTANFVAVVEAGVTLAELDEALAPLGLLYPVSPGEVSASIGGNVATNAGGMRAVRHGVTRHHVLGLEAVLPGGQVLRTGGRYVKSSSGYDLTQLLVGSEGTLAVVTEVTLKLQARPAHHATLLAPFKTLEAIGAVVPPVVASGIAPAILEYIDAFSMAGITGAAGLDLGIEAQVAEAAEAYLVVVLEGHDAGRIDDDTAALGELLTGLGALEVYVLPPNAGTQLVAARERAFFVAKAAGADDIVDTVVPRAAIPAFLAAVSELAARHGALVTGCGHVGDGNVHLSVFQPDAARRHDLLEAVFRAAADLGGAVSGEHGIGTEKRSYYLALADPAVLELNRRLKALFDPHAILSPGRLLDGPDPR